MWERDFSSVYPMVPMATATADGSVRLGRETTSSSIKVTMFTQHNAGRTGCRMKALAREWAELGTVLEQAARGEARLQASLWASQLPVAFLCHAWLMGTKANDTHLRRTKRGS